MLTSDKIAHKSDSLIELLTAQCIDLEKLLALARAETAAAERGDFDAILQIVTERAEVGSRLEVFQQQLAELRGFLGEAGQRAAVRRVRRPDGVAQLLPDVS